MLKITEGKTSKGRVLFKKQVGSWKEARPIALKLIAQNFVDYPVTVQLDNWICQVVTMDKKTADKILAS